MKNILNEQQIKDIKACGKILAYALGKTIENVASGISTSELDRIAENALIEKGATPSFKSYGVAGVGRYPFSICVSINDEIVHGLPSEKRFIKEGDIVSLDLGAKWHGICTDMAVTVPVGTISAEAQKLIFITQKSLELAISKIKRGKRIGIIGNTIQNYVEACDFGVVRDLVGHGIGVMPHMEPQIPNYGLKESGPIIENGMALAIEPMITAGDFQTKVGSNHWTISTKSGVLAAHFEHTVIIENGKAVIVTKAKMDNEQNEQQIET